MYYLCDLIPAAWEAQIWYRSAEMGGGALSENNATLLNGTRLSIDARLYLMISVFLEV